jgi:hypothetical protein
MKVEEGEESGVPEDEHEGLSLAPELLVVLPSLHLDPESSPQDPDETARQPGYGVELQLLPVHRTATLLEQDVRGEGGHPIRGTRTAQGTPHPAKPFEDPVAFPTPLQKRAHGSSELPGCGLALEELRDDPLSRDQIGEGHMVHLHQAPGEPEGGRVRAVGDDEWEPLECRFEGRGSRLHDPGTRVVKERPPVPDLPEGRVRGEVEPPVGCEGDADLEFREVLHQDLGGLGEGLEVPPDLLPARAGEDREDRAVGVEPGLRTERPAGRDFIGPVEQRVADEVRVPPAFRKISSSKGRITAIRSAARESRDARPFFQAQTWGAMYAMVGIPASWAASRARRLKPG